MKTTDVWGVPENYLRVVNTEFYIPTYLETDAITATLADGKPDAVSALYNNISITPWPANVTNKDIYNVTTPHGDPKDKISNEFTEQIKLLMSENMHEMASLNAGDSAKLCNADSCDVIYRAKVRGLLQKLPGFLFTSYKNPILTP